MSDAVDLRDYLRVLRLRWKIIVICTLAALGASALATLRTTPLYQADTQLFVSAASDANVNNQYTGNLFTQARVKSYQGIVNSPLVTQKVIDSLGLDTTPEALAGQISADAPLDTVLLNVHVRDAKPARAQQLANATARAFTQVIDTIEASQQSAGTAPVKVTIVRTASLPVTPVVPRTKLNLALGLLVGLALGVGLAVAREVLDTRLHNPAELEERFGLTTLSVVGFDGSAKQRPLIVHDDPRSVRAEAFRRLRTNLQFIDVDKRPRSIVVSSALPGEGKSTLTCNLAIALADAGVDVILIDGDLRRPALAEYLGIEGAVGLTNVLIGQVELEDALQPWGTSGHMKVLPSGSIPPNPSELLGSKQMVELVKLLETRALVIIDAPPLLPVTDAAILAGESSGALLVIRAKHTRREQIKAALEALRSVDAHVMGAVLNMAPTKGPGAYSYGYGYYGKSYASRTDLPSAPHVHVSELVSPQSPEAPAPAAPVSTPSVAVDEGASRDEPTGSDDAASAEMPPPASTELLPPTSSEASPSPTWATYEKAVAATASADPVAQDGDDDDSISEPAWRRA